MAFRDDDDAAFAQLEAVKRDAEEERRRHEQQQEKLRDQVGTLKKKLRDKDQQDPQRRARRVMVVSVSLLVVAGALTGYFVSTDRTSRRRAKAKPLEQVFKKKPDHALEQAEYYAERAHPKSERAALLALVAGAYLKGGDRKRAVELLDRGGKVLAAVEKDASSTRDLTHRAASHELRACVLGMMGRKEDAAGQRKRSRAILEAVVSYAVEMKVNSRAAWGCLRLGDATGARQLMERAVQAAVKLNNAYSRRRSLQQLADQALEMGEIKVLAAISTALQKDMPRRYRNSPETMALLAELAWRAGDKATAKEYLDQIQGRHLSTSRRMAQVGRLLAVMGQKDAARAMLQKALERARGDGHFGDSTREAIILGHAALGDTTRARTMCLTRRHFQALARAHLRAGRMNDALALVNLVGAANPDLSMCIALASAGHAEDALAMARKRSGNNRRAEALALVVAATKK